MDKEIRKLMPGELCYKLFTENENATWKNGPNEDCLPSREVVINKATQKIINSFSVKNNNQKLHFMLESSYGLGKSFVLENIVKKCVSFNVGGPVLHFTVTAECGITSLYRLLSAVGDSLDFIKESSVLEKYESNNSQKRKAIIEIIKNIRIICIDDADMSGGEIWNFLSKIIKNEKLNTVMLGSRTTSSNHFQEDEGINVFEIPKLTSQEAQIWIKEYKEKEWKTIDEAQTYNPVSLLLTVRANEMLAIDAMLSATDCLRDILKTVLSALTLSEKYLMSQFVLCRKPVPLKDNITVDNIVKLGLAEVTKGERCKSILLQPCIKMLVKEIMAEQKFNVDDEIKKCCRAVDLWKNLLHPKLQNLLSGAEQRKWPYIPEPWQFTDNVSEEDRYNLRDLLNKSNEYSEAVPMREFDVLQECLYHALVDEDYAEASAVAFLVDRYSFWQGDSNALMAIVDFITSVSPNTPIAPQIITRKARVRKNEGDLQGSGKILDSLIDDEKQAGSWRYKDMAEYLIIKAASIELKGNIFHGLGLWYEAASNFMGSTGLFRSFQKPDKKGLAAGLALLADTLQYMPNDDFGAFSRQFELPTEHPLLEAIRCVTEAAKYCVHTPLFYAKNKRRAGEFSLAYARYLDDKENQEEQWSYLRNAAFEILEGLKCHTSINRLESREQYYEFVSCVYRISQICRQLFAGNQNNSAEIFEKLAADLFQHYCSYPIKVKHNEKTVSLINRVMKILQLPELPWTDKLQTSGLPNVSINIDKKQDQMNNEKLLLIGEGLQSVDVSTVYSSEGSTSKGPIVFNETNANEDKAKPNNSDDKLRHVASDIRNQETVSSADGSIDFNEGLPQVEAVNGAERKGADEGIRDRNTLTSVESILQSAGSIEGSSDFQNAATWITGESDKGSVESSDTGYRSATTESTSESQTREDEKSKSGNLHKSVVTKLLKCYTAAEGETVEERNWRVESTAGTLEDIGTSSRILEEIQMQRISETGTNKVQKALVWRFDPISKEWSTTETLACVGEKLDFGICGGACRDAYNFEHLNQDDPYGKYVGKQYKLEKYKANPKSIQQYKQDIICQNTARYYVTLFNQRLYEKIKGQTFSQVQFLPAVLVELTNIQNDPERYFNVEPYMYGNFEKITNNAEHVTEREISEKDLLLAFSHFTYFASNGELLVVDIQGWTSQDKKGFHYLTDPQIHTRDKLGYGTGNLGQRGFDNFWLKQHDKCNDICIALGLRKPLINQNYLN